MAKGLMDENQQSSVEQEELDKLFPSPRYGGRRGESRGLHRVGAGEYSASTNDTNTSFATPSTTKRTIAEIWGSKLVETPSKSAVFSHVKPSDFRFVTWFMSILKFGLP